MVKEKETQPQVELTSIATQTVTGYKLPNGEVVQFEGLLLWIANQISEIKKAVA